MGDILNTIGGFLGFSPKIVSPLPQNSGPQFQNGQPAIAPAPYLTKMFPGENDWIMQQIDKNPQASVKDFAKEYYNAVTAPGGKYAMASPTPTPPPIPTHLAQIANDPGAPFNDTIVKAAQSYGIPAPLLKGVLAHESMQFAPQYVSGYHTDGSGRGVAAIDKNAHPEITDEQAFDPSFAIPWAAKTIAAYKAQEGNWFNALRRYNGGGNYDSNQAGFQGVPVATRTKDYANNVLKQSLHFSANAAGNTQHNLHIP